MLQCSSAAVQGPVVRCGGAGGLRVSIKVKAEDQGKVKAKSQVEVKVKS